MKCFWGTPYVWTLVRICIKKKQSNSILLLGNTPMLEALSPSVVALDPPDTLVLEIHSSGGYILTDWSKQDGNTYNPVAGSYAHFGEIYYRSNTTTDDLGRYRARLHPVDPSEISPEVYFDVVRPGNAGLVQCQHHNHACAVYYS